MIISKRAIWQYFMLYCMMIGCWSTLYWQYSESMPIILLAISIMCKLITRQSWKNNFNTLFVIVFVIFIAFNYLNGNDAGLGTILQFLMPVFLVDAYYGIDPREACPRFIRGVTFYAGISLVFTIIANVNSSLLKMILSPIPSNNFDLYGKIVYTLQGSAGDTVRNCGLYTEPGLYQIILNIALFLVLYIDFNDYFARSQKNKFIVILIVTIVSTLSTMGLITMAFIILGSMNAKNSERKRVILLVFLVVSFIAIDNYVNGTESILNRYVIDKFAVYGQSSQWGTLNSIDARLRAFEVVGYSLSQNIFGVGGTRFAGYMSMFNLETIAGNGLLRWLAILGIHVWLLLIIYIFYPLFKERVKWRVIAIFTIIYVMYSLSQLYLFIPIILFCSLSLQYYSDTQIIETDD